MFTKKRNQKLISILFILAVLLSNVQTPVVSAQTGDGLKRQVNPESGRVSFIGPEMDGCFLLQSLGYFLPPARPSYGARKSFCA